MVVVGDFSVRGGIRRSSPPSTRRKAAGLDEGSGLRSGFGAQGSGLESGRCGMSEEPIRIPIEHELDLHAFPPRDIASVVQEYIDAAAAAGLREVRVVHGAAAASSAASCRRRSNGTRRSSNFRTTTPLIWARRSPGWLQIRNRAGGKLSGTRPGGGEQSQILARICQTRAVRNLRLGPSVANLASKQTMTAGSTRPVCDEWGVYDPQQAGFEAIMRRLLPNDEPDDDPLALSFAPGAATSTRQP